MTAPRSSEGKAGAGALAGLVVEGADVALAKGRQAAHALALLAQGRPGPQDALAAAHGTRAQHVHARRITATKHPPAALALHFGFFCGGGGN